MNVIRFPVSQDRVLQKREKKSVPVTLRLGKKRLNMRLTHSVDCELQALADRYNINRSEAFRRAAVYMHRKADGFLSKLPFDAIMRMEFDNLIWLESCGLH